MNIETYWLNATPEQRRWVLRDAGWRTQNGKADRTACMMCRRIWEKLTPTVRNVLISRARAGMISA